MGAPSSSNDEAEATPSQLRLPSIFTSKLGSKEKSGNAEREDGRETAAIDMSSFRSALPKPKKAESFLLPPKPPGAVGSSVRDVRTTGQKRVQSFGAFDPATSDISASRALNAPASITGGTGGTERGGPHAVDSNPRRSSPLVFGATDDGGAPNSGAATGGRRPGLPRRQGTFPPDQQGAATSFAGGDGMAPRAPLGPAGTGSGAAADAGPCPPRPDQGHGSLPALALLKQHRGMHPAQQGSGRGQGGASTLANSNGGTSGSVEGGAGDPADGSSDGHGNGRRSPITASSPVVPPAPSPLIIPARQPSGGHAEGAHSHPHAPGGAPALRWWEEPLSPMSAAVMSAMAEGEVGFEPCGQGMGSNAQGFGRGGGGGARRGPSHLGRVNEGDAAALAAQQQQQPVVGERPNAETDRRRGGIGEPQGGGVQAVAGDGTGGGGGGGSSRRANASSSASGVGAGADAGSRVPRKLSGTTAHGNMSPAAGPPSSSSSVPAGAGPLGGRSTDAGRLPDAPPRPQVQAPRGVASGRRGPAQGERATSGRGNYGAPGGKGANIDSGVLAESGEPEAVLQPVAKKVEAGALCSELVLAKQGSRGAGGGGAASSAAAARLRPEATSSNSNSNNNNVFSRLYNHARTKEDTRTGQPVGWLTPDQLACVFAWVESPGELATLARVCMAWRDVTTTSDALWEALTRARWPKTGATPLSVSATTPVHGGASAGVGASTSGGGGRMGANRSARGVEPCGWKRHYVEMHRRASVSKGAKLAAKMANVGQLRKRLKIDSSSQGGASASKAFAEYDFAPGALEGGWKRLAPEFSVRLNGGPTWHTIKPGKGSQLVYPSACTLHLTPDMLGTNVSLGQLSSVTVMARCPPIDRSFLVVDMSGPELGERGWTPVCDPQGGALALYQRLASQGGSTLLLGTLIEGVTGGTANGDNQGGLGGAASSSTMPPLRPDSQVALLCLNIHHLDVLGAALMLLSPLSGLLPRHTILYDDVDPAYGLHDYHVSVGIRSLNVLLWQQEFHKVHYNKELSMAPPSYPAQSQPHSSRQGGSKDGEPLARFVLVERAKASGGQLTYFKGEPQLFWRTAAFSGTLLGVFVMDVTVWDEAGHVAWHHSGAACAGVRGAEGRNGAGSAAAIPNYAASDDAPTPVVATLREEGRGVCITLETVTHTLRPGSTGGDTRGGRGGDRRADKETAICYLELALQPHFLKQWFGVAHLGSASVDSIR